MSGNNIIFEEIAKSAITGERARIIGIINSMPYEKRDDWELISRHMLLGEIGAIYE